MSPLVSDKILLALETATSVCSVALFSHGEFLTVLEESTDRNHCELLPRLVNAAFAKVHRSPADTSIIAVSIGPGSFTGLRVGLSFAKGMATTCGAAIAPVGSLDALALSLRHRIDRGGGHDWSGRLCPLIFARHGEVFIRVFAPVEGGIKALSDPMLVKVSELAKHVNGPTWIGGESLEIIAPEIRKTLPFEARLVGNVQSSARHVCQLAINDWLLPGKALPDIHQLEPHYLAEFTVKKD